MPDLVRISDEIKLDQFLKWSRLASTGGESKHMIKNGLVRVNGVTEARRGRVLKHGDVVQIEREGEYVVSSRSTDTGN